MPHTTNSKHPSSGEPSSQRPYSEVSQRHAVLKEQYSKDPNSAMITDSSEVLGIHLFDPFRTTVSINENMKTPLIVGVHKAVGGDHDFPNPGDILCAALAACFDSTLRLISNRMGIKLIETNIKATATVDVRGTLMFDKSIPVGFQSMHVHARIIIKDPSEPKIRTLINGVEHCCIVYQTIKKGIPIRVDFKFD